MKIAAGRIEGFLARPDPKAAIVLLFGPDAGLVAERARRLVLQVVDDPGDPFRVSDLTGDQIRGDPGRLQDEARAQSLLGGRRVVRVSGAGDGVTAACKELLQIEDLPSLVVLEAGELAAASSLRQLIERAQNAAALPCYRDEGQGLARSIVQMLAEHRLEADADALDWLVTHLGADRGVTRKEIEKLALHAAGGDGRVRLEDAALLIGDSAALGIDDFVHATATGDHARLDTVLARLEREGEAAVRLIRALVRHWLLLYRLHARMSEGSSADQAIGQMRPPVHFRARPHVERALAAWSPASLEQALHRLLSAETRAKSGLPPAAICRRIAFELCARAARGRHAVRQRAGIRRRDPYNGRDDLRRQ